MGTQVRATDDPVLVLAEAEEFLAEDPVGNSVILTLLHSRAAFPQPGRYWIVDVDSVTAGLVLQSPLDFAATFTPMGDSAVRSVVDAIVTAGVDLPGVSGDALTAARFAGHWSERTRSGARPCQGQRIYEVEDVIELVPSRGELRRAAGGDRELLLVWYAAFQAEIGETPRDVTAVVERRLAAGHLWIWEDQGPVALAGLSPVLAGVARIGPVYTPPDHRNHGYATSLVAAISSAVRRGGNRCILYTDLANPTSNSIYRALGYRAVAEAIRYSFDSRHRPKPGEHHGSRVPRIVDGNPPSRRP